MKIIRAEHLGMCFGVRDAIALALEQSRKTPLTILGDLVHNETVLADLRARGIKVTDELSAVATDTVMITAHGASWKRMRGVRDSGLNLLEETCPLVHVAHRAVAKLVDEGFYPVIIGKRGHVEVRGLTEDLPEFDVVLSEAEVFELKERARFGVAAQTTQPIEKVRNLVDCLRNGFRIPRCGSLIRFAGQRSSGKMRRSNWRRNQMWWSSSAEPIAIIRMSWSRRAVVIAEMFITCRRPRTCARNGLKRRTSLA